jgi:hypothetical protein
MQIQGGAYSPGSGAQQAVGASQTAGPLDPYKADLDAYDTARLLLFADITGPGGPHSPAQQAVYDAMDQLQALGPNPKLADYVAIMQKMPQLVTNLKAEYQAKYGVEMPTTFPAIIQANVNHIVANPALDDAGKQKQLADLAQQVAGGVVYGVDYSSCAQAETTVVDAYFQYASPTAQAAWSTYQGQIQQAAGSPPVGGTNPMLDKIMQNVNQDSFDKKLTPTDAWVIQCAISVARFAPSS